MSSSSLPRYGHRCCSGTTAPKQPSTQAPLTPCPSSVHGEGRMGVSHHPHRVRQGKVIPPSSLRPPLTSPDLSSTLVPHRRGLRKGSHLVHFVALSVLPASKETAQLLVYQVFRIHGITVDIVSDRGPEFVSWVWKDTRAALLRTADANKEGRTGGALMPLHTSWGSRFPSGPIPANCLPDPFTWVEALCMCVVSVLNYNKSHERIRPSPRDTLDANCKR